MKGLGGFAKDFMGFTKDFNAFAKNAIGFPKALVAFAKGYAGFAKDLIAFRKIRGAFPKPFDPFAKGWIVFGKSIQPYPKHFILIRKDSNCLTECLFYLPMVLFGTPRSAAAPSAQLWFATPGASGLPAHLKQLRSLGAALDGAVGAP